MQSVILANISEGDLTYLFGKSEKTIQRWIKAGLPKNADGSFTLSKAIRWREAQHKIESEKILQVPISQVESVKFLGISRQRLTALKQSGLRPGRKGYMLPAVVRWLRLYYETAARKKYDQKLKTMRKRVGRNTAQLYRFLSSGKDIK